MFRALILVRNFDSTADTVNFGEFSIRRIGLHFKDLRESFSSTDVNQDDWLLEKSYSRLPPGPPGSPVGGIPHDLEDALLLLRLFKFGDLSFIKQAIIPPNGSVLVQFPYRAMNDLNSYSLLRFEMAPEECDKWRSFADQVRHSQSWGSDWFSTTRRFFLSGGAKNFNPRWENVDRIVDYSTALEAALVPESDYNARRISNRAGALLAREGLEEQPIVARFLKRLYGIRSRIVHGAPLREEIRTWLLDNWEQIETRMRQILVAAVKNLPPGDEDRRKALSDLYDLTDKDRSELALQKFREIRSDSVRRQTAAKIAELSEK